MQHTHVLNTEKLHSNRPSGCQLTHLVSEPLDRKPPHGRRDSVSLRFHGDSSGSARTTGDYTVREAAAARQRTGTSQLA